jgi:CheY-like chemotaxis protein
MILNPRLPDMGAGEFVDRLIEARGNAPLPVLVHGEDSFSVDESTAVRRLSQVATVREVHRPERLLDLAALFLHQPLEGLSPTQRDVIEELRNGEGSLQGRTVLVVDDDIRNIFALTSVLEQHRMNILAAETGRQAIEMLEQRPDIDIVLMDVMMPEMDGLDTTRAIRGIQQLKQVPIIAVTAKAMKGDREKCIEAGAWDYLSKPVNRDDLLAVLHAWLHR